MIKSSIFFVSVALIVSLFAITVHGADKTSQLKPDLTVAKFKIDPEKPERGDWVTLSAKVMNKGSAPSAPCQAAIQINDEPDPPMYPVPKLDPEETFTITREQKMKDPGVYKVTFIADYYRTVDERREVNNAVYWDFLVRENE